MKHLKNKIPSIHFFCQGINYTLKNKKKIKIWLKEIVGNHNKSVGELSIIFCSDLELLEINKKWLNHNDLTDIITFNYNENSTINGDIFISVERVKENAKEMKINFMEEFLRVVAHGVLHLIGYNDKDNIEIQEMRKAENESIALYYHLNR